MRKLCLIVTVLFLAVLFASCIYHVATVPVVQRIPRGFVSLDEAVSSSGIITYGFFESVIYVSDLDGTTIYQTMLNDRSFVAKYKNEIYVNGAKLEKAMEKARVTEEERKRIYKLNEAVRIKDGVLYITDVEYKHSFEGIQMNDNEWLCVLTVNTDSDGIKNWFLETFDYIETPDGDTYSDFIRIHPQIYPNLIAINIPKGKKAQFLYLTSNNYTYRKIDISDKINNDTDNNSQRMFRRNNGKDW